MVIIIAIYVFLFSLLLISKSFVLAFLLVLTIPFLALIIRAGRKVKLVNYKRKIDDAKAKFTDGIEFEPFINVNKSKSYIIELIPGVQPAAAKRLVNQVRLQGKINNFVDFANVVDLDTALYELDKKIIKY